MWWQVCLTPKLPRHDVATEACVKVWHHENDGVPKSSVRCGGGRQVGEMPWVDRGDPAAIPRGLDSYVSGEP